MIGLGLGWFLLCGFRHKPWVALDCWYGDVLASGIDLGWERWFCGRVGHCGIGITALAR